MHASTVFTLSDYRPYCRGVEAIGVKASTTANAEPTPPPYLRVARLSLDWRCAILLTWLAGYKVTHVSLPTSNRVNARGYLVTRDRAGFRPLNIGINCVARGVYSVYRLEFPGTYLAYTWAASRVPPPPHLPRGGKAPRLIDAAPDATGARGVVLAFRTAPIYNSAR
ncbi:unnamed protein product [Leptosia nina]|uniref:Uncharacterized protein n=1 Tax=Leptosia nina TaxID=320188 RepID=A0AAV1JPT9_9NEOP